MNLKRIATGLVAFFASLAIMLGLALAPAQATLNDGKVTVRVVTTSQSNMLVSFQNIYTGVFYQKIIEINVKHGECGCPDSTSEPQNMWVNPGYTGSYRWVWKDANTGAVTATGAWKSYAAGASGISVHVNPGPGVPASYNVDVQLSLVKNNF